MNIFQGLDDWVLSLFSGIVPEALTLPVGGPCYACGDYVVDDEDPIWHPPKRNPKARYFGAVLPYWEAGPQPQMRECERCGVRRRWPWLLREEIDQLIGVKGKEINRLIASFA